MPRCLLGLGANLGDRRKQLDAAIEQLTRDRRVELISVSSYLGTQPVGGPPDQGEFLNAAAVLETSLQPLEVWQLLRDVEQTLGRQRNVRWEARSIDLDILLYDQWILSTPLLTVPHPWMIARRFVLQPAAEIAGDWRHPILQWTIQQLWEHAQTAAPRFALAGSFDPSIGPAVAAKVGAKWIARPKLATSSDVISRCNSPLDWLNHCQQTMEQSGWNSAERSLLLSEFSLDDQWFRAQSATQSSGLAAFVEEFEHQLGQMTPPKLVFIGAPDAKSDPEATESCSPLAADGSPYSAVTSDHNQLLQHFIDQGRSLAVIMRVSNPQEIIREIAGAITAIESN